ncbi:MAG: hypothetical protein NZ895_01075 [Archaeoglobaceae archaeon]|nr:hypothetical protein [Archaeoglobaceae archaeon]MCX8152009.1 hypothetical protein [Archaeoglobaceae archaeon]MDW8013398.1 hypothetical protein [Archaeoglobaceae archaeon]
MDLKFVSLTIVLLGSLLVLTGVMMYLFSLPSMKDLKFLENPLVFIPIKKDGFVVGFSPLLLIIFFLLWLFFFKL